MTLSAVRREILPDSGAPVLQPDIRGAGNDADSFEVPKATMRTQSFGVKLAMVALRF